ncbi:ROK family protein [Spelaeicoccus albus]|uniref:Glucokinase n=1 Tax=Spelaeicoccus albus TaxID=1280376 RepID=A0A7Z0ABD1_9MICO|nr:ROK family protein [Spelaeicoccus albus]NYI67083.1 glucokinase [Spelaeicoccus albus]
MNDGDEAPASTGTDDVIAGIDIGGTTTNVLLCRSDLGVIDTVQIPTAAQRGGDVIVRDAVAALTRLAATHRVEPRAVGVGAAGVVDPRSGHVLVASRSFAGWSGYHVTGAITDALGVPAYLDNDVNAFLRGEVLAGAVAGEDYVLGVTLGTGVGGALWMDGALMTGAHGAAGEIGHLPGFGNCMCSCGERGHLETVASGWAIARRFTEISGRAATAKDAAAAAQDGDRGAAEILSDAGHALGHAAVLTAGLIDVTTVVIGGGVSDAWEFLEPAIGETLTAEPVVSGHPVKVVKAALGNLSVALGAAACATTSMR